jgi:hypothetical protein
VQGSFRLPEMAGNDVQGSFRLPKNASQHIKTR